MPSPMYSPSAWYPTSISMSHTARESFPPLTATSTDRRLQHVEVVDRLRHLAATQLLQMLGAEVGVVPGQIDDRRRLAHLALAADGGHAAPPEITGRTSIDVVLVEAGVAGHERAVADHEVGFPRSGRDRRAERLTERAPCTSISRRGLRSRTHGSDVRSDLHDRIVTGGSSGPGSRPRPSRTPWPSSVPVPCAACASPASRWSP